MAITLRVFKRLVNGTPQDEVSYNGARTNPAYFSVAVVPVSGNNYAPDEQGLTLYVKLETTTNDRGIDLKVKAEPLSTGNPPDTVMDGFEAWSPYDDTTGEWENCFQRFVTVSIPGRILPPNSVIPVKLRIRSDAGDPIGEWYALLHFLVYNIGP